MMQGIPVLMYHALEDADHPAGAKDPGEQLYVLQVSQFHEQMQYLHRQGFRTYLLDELQRMEVWPEKAVVLTFDDGHESNYTLALPILQEFGFKAHFFITTGWIGTPCFMTAGQIRELHAAGMSIGSHGVTHKFINDMNQAGIYFELSESKLALEKITGSEVTAFSAPGGRICKRSSQASRRIGYRSFTTSVVGLVSRSMLEKAIPRCIIRAATTIAEFATIAAGDSDTVDRMARKAKALGMAKKVLGNQTYDLMRKILLR